MNHRKYELLIFANTTKKAFWAEKKRKKEKERNTYMERENLIVGT